MTDTDIVMTTAVSYSDFSTYNPLSFDFAGAVNQLSVVIKGSIFASLDLSVIHDPSLASSKTVLLETISKAMLNPEWTNCIIDLFRPIVIDLVARWTLPGFTDFIDANPASPNSNKTVYKIELVAKAFSTVLPTVPQVKSLAVSYFSHSTSLFERLNHINLSKETEITQTLTAELFELLLTAYRLLSFSSSTFIPIWNWGPVVQLLEYREPTIQYMAILCLSKVYQLSDVQTKSLITATVGAGKSIDELETPIHVIIDGTRVDIRLLDLWEQQRLAEAQVAYMKNNHEAADTEPALSNEDLCHLTSNLCGVLLPRISSSIVKEDSDTLSYDPKLILTPTTSKNLHAISLALSIGAPTLLEGVTGAGKTALVEELAARTGRGADLVKIHLGDQTDPKVLLGTYVSTATPGSFRWQAGVLTTAVLEGRWVLIEDIDLAPAEVLSVLLPLLETRHLFIPSRGEKIKAKEGFQLFGTRSFVPTKSGKGSQPRGGELTTGGNLWTRVYVEPLSADELESVIRQKFTHIGDFAPHVMNLYKAAVDMYQDPNFSMLSTSTMGRFLSTRDLIKWCHRVDLLIGEKLSNSNEVGMDLTLRQDLFSEANDCFCGMIPDYNVWVTVLQTLGRPLQISEELVRNYVDQYKPAFDVNDTNIRIGRVNLSAIAASGKQKQKQSLVKREKKRPFATTGHALRLMERIAVCIHLTEPVLLVGETGTGKTTVVQHLADMMNQSLIVVNLSQQSDSSDLLGGFKPVDAKVLAIPLKEDFERLFEKTFSVKKNVKFLDMARKTFVHQKWKNFVALLKQAYKMSQQKFEAEQTSESKKVSSPTLRNAWKMFLKRIEEFEVQQVQSQNKFVFNFMEGSLVKAVRQGDWILLDEINLATTETLECLSGLLQDANGSLLLTEKGDVEPIKRHPNFRLFACMNPATDVGKRDLPPGLRNRFTEFYVHPPDNRYDDLLQIVKQYLVGIASGDEKAYDDVAEFYLSAKKLAAEHKLVDGANQRPHFSMRTLARALTYVCQIFPVYGLRRSLYEGFCMTFLTQLDKQSETLMHDLIFKTILRGIQNPKNLITQIPRQPRDDFIQFGYFWLEQGQFLPEEDTKYIITPSVETKLYNLARVIMSRKFPVLIQGPTSAGKTSMIEYMAKKTGHRFVRVNNHEHTDLQEYLGTYVSNNEGKLVFQEGVLVEALRKGYWIVLDELNLAPSDVLEALNRLLDDNRELLIPETQEIVKPHPHFMLFATQNPAGLYGGRKALSRAFRNRFLELHFDDIPEDELETILSRRCSIAPSYCKKLVKVYKELMERRQSTRIFEQKHGFITLRDLFRWAGRDSLGYQELAENGYMLLAERCRKDEEKKVVKQVLEQVMKVKIEETAIYDCTKLEEFAIYNQLLEKQAAHAGEDTKLVWTKAMRRLFTLVARCLKYNEPVLLVGETGCGKTTVCQMLAETYNRELHIVNCHQNTETGDLLGGQRPVRNRDTAEDSEAQQQLFEWHDGPLVQAMKEGHLFLLDEISLADDSVLERLNSVLEPSRLLVLAEKGGKQVEELFASPNFQFLATMNPGGDYGKKELSPALRNRFTEIWVPSVTDKEDLIAIINEQLADPELKCYSEKILDFITWYTQAMGQNRTIVSLRDILSWVKFINVAVESGISHDLSFVHGGCLVLLDGLGSHGSSGSFLSGTLLDEFRLKCLRRLSSKPDAAELDILGSVKDNIQSADDKFAIGPFQISRGQLAKTDIKFTLLAPTTADNAMRVIRAMQLKKPILLEGSPGVGKTSLISALAAASGHNLVRINLSEQTDLMDLFGSDLPVEGGSSGEFAWRDAPFLQAMKAGDWVLLDELNLASQSVLEGLNSCLDHRGAVYIPELDREFFCHKNFRVFGAQNPLQQGGGRKGLPKSFVNRFTQVYVKHLSPDDLLFICTHLFPDFAPELLAKMIEFNNRIYEETMVRCSFGRKGSPWEFNLRDVFRWLELMQKDQVYSPAEYLDIIYLQRMRTCEDRVKIVNLFESVFDEKYDYSAQPSYSVTTDSFNVGHSRLARKEMSVSSDTSEQENHILQTFLSPLEALMKCVELSWMAIINGPSACGKTSLVRLLSKITGNHLEEFAMNNSVDTMELLGGFEQVDLNRHRQVIVETLRQMVVQSSRKLLVYITNFTAADEHYTNALRLLRQINESWFVLENKQQLEANSIDTESGKLDYALISNIINLLRSTASIDPESALAIDALVVSIENVQKLEKESVAGKFEWIDGLLIHALEKGHWLLIDNANLCNPSVLDRLNPLFENNGVLMVNERGLVDGTVKVIKPHPNFRMFMTVDPQYGELSRAMRNRGIEISLIDANMNSNTQDVIKLANSLGIRGSELPLLLKTLQQEAAIQRKQFFKTENIRDYLLFTTYLTERLQRGQTLKSALHDSFLQVFVDVKDLPGVLDTLLQSEAESAHLLATPSPTNFPTLINGRLFSDDSTLATVALHGAYLAYLLLTPGESNAELAKKSDIAGDYFIEHLNVENYGLSLRFASHMAHQTTIENTDILERLVYLIKELAPHPLFAKYSQMQHSHDNGPLSNLDDFNCTRKAYQLLLRLFKNKFAVKQMQSTAQRMKSGSLTALQQSYSFYEGRLNESQLLHPVVPKLYPFFTSVSEKFLSWIDQNHYHACSEETFALINRILDVCDFAWYLTQLPSLSLDNLVIIMKITKELILSKNINDTSLDDLLVRIEDILSGFDVTTSLSMKTLWKYFSPPTLSSLPLHDLEKKLRQLSADMDDYSFGKEQGLNSKSLILHVNREVKEALVEGIATLYVVGENDSEIAEVLNSLTKLPEYVQRELAACSSSLETAKEDNKWDTALIPIQDYASIITEMELLASLYNIISASPDAFTLQNIKEEISKFKNFVLDKSSRTPLDMIPYQRLIWLFDTDNITNMVNGLPGMIQDAVYGYHQRLWRSSLFQQDLHHLTPKEEQQKLPITEGPLSLYESVETITCLNILSSVESLDTQSFENALKQLVGLKQYLSSSNNTSDRKYSELVVLISLASQLFYAASPLFPKDVTSSVCSAFDNINALAKPLLSHSVYSDKNFAHELEGIMERMNDVLVHIQDLDINAFYVEALYQLAATVSHLKSGSREEFFKTAGRTRVLLGLAFVTAYIPDYPVDPTSEPRLHVNLLTAKKSKLEENIDVRTNIEIVYTGNNTNTRIKEEQAILDEVNVQISKSKTVFSLRPEQAQLEEIFVDLRYLQKSMLEKNVENLLNDFETGSMESVLQREELLQGNALQFIDRVNQKFPLYKDILQPLLVAVQNIKYGLRLLISNFKKDAMDSFISEVVQFLISDGTCSEYLSSEKWSNLSANDSLVKLRDIIFSRSSTSKKWSLYLRILIVILQHLIHSINIHGTLTAENLVSINIIYNEIVQVWKAAEEYRKKQEAEKEALFKTRAKKYEAVPDEELEERDMKKIFAAFDEEFADLTIEDNDEPVKASAPAEVEEVSVLNSDDIRRIGHLHKWLFNTYSHANCNRSKKNWDGETTQAYAAAGELSNMTNSAFEDTMDRSCKVGNMRATSLIIKRLESDSPLQSNDGKIYDFYQNENVAEAKRVVPIVNRFKARVLQLLDQWPEHAILSQLVVISDRILSFSVLSPVSKFLTGVELLLQKSEDWEAYAAKHVSLKDQREELTKLIVDWRQLELNCWPKLLEAQEQYHQDAAFDWWFNLYDAVNNTSLTSEKEEKNVKNTQDLLGALDHFLQTAPVIEFSPRLAMVDSFYKQVMLQSSLSPNASEQANYEKVATILRNVYMYYLQFEERAKTLMAQLRQPIEKELKDFVKIATWKDVNIYALRQSASKTHRQLHKCIRKYREVLSTSMLTVIANYNEEYAMYQYGDDKRYSKDINMSLVSQLPQASVWLSTLELPDVKSAVNLPSDSIKAHLSDLSVTLRRMKGYCRKDIFIDDDDIKDLPLEKFMTEIIDQIKYFQKETPAVMTEENKSMVKNQKLLKKKALVDFLKELRRLGLKSRLGRMKEENSDTVSLFNQKVADLEFLAFSKGTYHGDLSTITDASVGAMEQWRKANDYYFRSIARLTHLRTLSTTKTSKDLSLLEIERALSATEHMFTLTHKERSLLARAEGSLMVLQGFALQMSALYSSFKKGHTLSSDREKVSILSKHKIYVDEVASLLSQALHTLSLSNEASHQQCMRELRDMYDSIEKLQKIIDELYVLRYLFPKAATGINLAAITSDIEALIRSNMEKIDTMYNRLQSIIFAQPGYNYIIYPILQHMKATSMFADASIDAVETTDISVTDLRDRIYSLIDVSLLAIQDLKKVNDNLTETTVTVSEDTEDQNDLADDFIRQQNKKQFSLANALHLEAASRRSLDILSAIFSLIAQVNSNTSIAEHISCLIQEVYPFLQQYLLIAQHTLTKILVHHKSMAKLTYCMINSFSIIITKGFCMPEGADDGEEGEADGTATGTGIGEGEGTKDVGEEIEDEEQVLGTQNEERSKDEQKQDTKEEKNGLDMENDFDGNLEDVEQSEDENKDESESSDEEEDPDEQIGDVDDMDPDAVDDKMWGDEAEEELKESDKTVDDAGNQQQQKDSEIVAKEDGDQQQDPKNDTRDESTENDDQQMKGEEEEMDSNGGSGDEEEMEGEGEDEEDVENKAGEQLNAEIPEAETLDLPDDMNLDGDQNEGEDEEAGEDMNDPMDMDETSGGQEEEQVQEEEDGGEAFKDALDDIDENMNDKDEEMADTTAETDIDQLDANEDTEDNQDKENVEGEKEEDLVDETGDAEQQQKNGQIMEDEQDAEEESKAHGREQPSSDAVADNQFGVQGEAGKQSKSSGKNNEGEEEDTSAEAEDDSTALKEQSGAPEGGSGQANQKEDADSENQDEKMEEESNQDMANPQRSLGDALERWRRRLADVNDGETEEEQEPDTEKKDTEADENRVNEDTSFEYVKNDEEAHDMQTMGNARPDQIQDIDLAAIDEETTDDHKTSGEMDIDEPVEDNDNSMPLPRETLEASGGLDTQGAILNKKLNEPRTFDENEVLKMDESLIAHEPLDQEDIERIREDLENEVSYWRDEGRDINKARELWQGYENLTYDLAMGLCEQLRLILEPTLATKLKGDYRTGKRLNMKKIIPYIASQFKKDKIWLRRTKPSKRQYQVMISVDDSKSMSESHSVQLAYEALALISKALSQLEVGEISITSFGERVRLLHSFDQPFTSESGAQVMQKFTFAQQKTFVKNLIETSIGLFENAKHASGPGNAELWHLQLIISDGICEDHEALQALVRRAMEEQIMIIFIIVDNKPEKDSILNMTNVKYAIKDGKYDIQMTSYLETFPFQYFMVLRDINSLPEVLSDALRQYFSFVSA